MRVCSKCGAPVADFDKFCQECGTPMPVSTDPSQDERLYGRVPEQAAPQTVQAKGGKKSAQKEPKQPLSLKPSKSFIKGLICGLAIMVAVIIAMISMNKMTFSAAKTAYSQVEGVGYRSVDDAVKAFADAFAAKDYEKMLSTFAVETYVENYDLAAQIDRIQNYAYTTLTISLPNDNSFVGEILRQNRISEINSMIAFEYLQVTGIAGKLGDDMLKVIHEGFDSGADLIDTKLSGGRHFDDLTIEAGSVLMPGTISDKYSTELNLNNLEKTKTVLGADQIESRAVELTVNGKEYIICMECVCYNGKWYNETMRGNLSAILGLDYSSGGMAPKSELGL